jgi:uncharacterized linocin/CFP29 family protein
LVKAVHAALLRLEERGYYTEYHLALGEKLWVALHEPTAGSLVLPRDRIEPSLAGGALHRTTAIPAEEALLISLDGPTLDRVSAGSPGARPKFEFLRAETDKNREEIYRFRIRERFAPRVRESHAVVRLATTP